MKQNQKNILKNSLKFAMIQKKWVKEDFDPFQNKKKLIEICGHYVFTHSCLIEIKSNLIDIDNKIISALKNRLNHIYSL